MSDSIFKDELKSMSLLAMIWCIVGLGILAILPMLVNWMGQNSINVKAQTDAQMQAAASLELIAIRLESGTIAIQNIALEQQITRYKNCKGDKP